jgi:4-carboxymuconolactone decarboxylase
MSNSDRFNKGFEKLKEIDGEAGEKVLESLKDICPDLGKFIIEYSFGDIYSREGLDLKSKEIAVVAALTAMGNAVPQLKVHLNGALNTGSSIDEIKEVILQMSSYSGFPSAINAMNLLKDVLKERGMQYKPAEISLESSGDRYEKGKLFLSKLDEHQAEKMEMTYRNFAPDLVKYVIEFGYGDIVSRPALELKYRQIATIAALTALGNAKPQLKFHISGGLNIGVTAEEIKEIMLLMSVFAGFPAAINGINALREVLQERGI